MSDEHIAHLETLIRQLQQRIQVTESEVKILYQRLHALANHAQGNEGKINELMEVLESLLDTRAHGME